MCIICHAAKKRHIKREEVLESMRTNPSGFFMAALHSDGTRETIRTMEKDIAIKFFDDNVKEEDEFVMHARIPSRGDKNDVNIHGWEEENILFCHNMTISSLDSMMKHYKWNGTDSEFFFRKVFIPHYKACGEEAYKDGKFCEELDLLVSFFVGYNNKFCFIMPDNKVIRYGEWVSEKDRLEDGKVAFYASNGNYRVSSFTGKTTGYSGYSGSSCGYPSQRGGTAAYAAGFPDYDDDPYGFYGEGYEHFSFSDSKRGKKGKSKSKSRTVQRSAFFEEDFDGQTLLKLAGVRGVCQIALQHLVFENVLQCREIYGEKEDAASEADASFYLRGLLPKAYGADAYSSLEDALVRLADNNTLGYGVKAVEHYVENFAKEIAPVYEELLVKEKSPFAKLATSWSVQLGLDELEKKTSMLKRLMNVSINFIADDPSDLASAYVIDNSSTGTQAEMLVMAFEDILGVDSIRGDDMPDVLQMLMAVINDRTEELYGEEGRVESGEAAPEPIEPSDDDPANSGVAIDSDGSADDSIVETDYVETEDPFASDYDVTDAVENKGQGSETPDPKKEGDQ